MVDTKSEFHNGISSQCRSLLPILILIRMFRPLTLISSGNIFKILGPLTRSSESQAWGEVEDQKYLFQQIF